MRRSPSSSRICFSPSSCWDVVAPILPLRRVPHLDLLTLFGLPRLSGTRIAAFLNRRCSLLQVEEERRSFIFQNHFDGVVSGFVSLSPSNGLAIAPPTVFLYIIGLYPNARLGDPTTIVPLRLVMATKMCKISWTMPIPR